MGAIGVWRSGRNLTPDLAHHIDTLGFGALWVGGSPTADLTEVEALVEAAGTMLVATGIVNIWNTEARQVAESFARIDERHPGRFILGLGVSHPERYGAPAATPYGAMVDYLDVLDEAGVPADRRVLAALGPRMLRLAAERSLGAHPYLVTPEHTRVARAQLGSHALLMPEQHVVLRSDRSAARTIARTRVGTPYLGMRNYRNNLLRIGFTEDDLEGSGSDRLVDELVAMGGASEVIARVHEHLDAGADHVALQLVSGPDDDIEGDYALLATAFSLARRSE